MLISSTCKYAIRAVVYLARHYEPDVRIGLKQIASDLAIPLPFLGKILQTLTRHKILFSTKGPHGGFTLSKHPREITFYEIVEIIDGTDVFLECPFGLEACLTDRLKQNVCPLHSKSSPVRHQLYLLFKNQSIGDVLEADGDSISQLNY